MGVRRWFISGMTRGLSGRRRRLLGFRVRGAKAADGMELLIRFSAVLTSWLVSLG
jgi:hypothetical protein